MTLTLKKGGVKITIYDNIIFTLFFFFCHMACGILVPDQGLNSCPLQWKCKLLATGSPGNSIYHNLKKKITNLYSITTNNINYYNNINIVMFVFENFCGI